MSAAADTTNIPKIIDDIDPRDRTPSSMCPITPPSDEELLKVLLASPEMKCISSSIDPSGISLISPLPIKRPFNPFLPPEKRVKIGRTAILPELLDMCKKRPRETDVTYESRIPPKRIRIRITSRS